METITQNADHLANLILAGIYVAKSMYVEVSNEIQ